MLDIRHHDAQPGRINERVQDLHHIWKGLQLPQYLRLTAIEDECIFGKHLDGNGLSILGKASLENPSIRAFPNELLDEILAAQKLFFLSGIGRSTSGRS